ncbi:hypothetical protein PQX77_022153 [Marasmius sp. AFHP31]|nr:hypothetical protein PQX77_022153 [Marasmius sp. AFHP31]
MDATSNSLMAPAPPLAFNADVFSRILMLIGTKDRDMLWLWTTCREVSRDFKEAVERVFILRHLKKTWLKVDGGWAYSEKHGKVSLATEFSFSHLDPNDRTRAIFRDVECHDDFKPMMKRHLKSTFEYGNPVHRPKIVIQIRRQANDTPIPGLEFNFDNLEMKLDWMAMYSEWFKEGKEHTRYLASMVHGDGGLAAKAIEMREKVERGEMDMMESFEWAIKSFFNGHTDASQKIRTERIARNVRNDGGIDDWNDPDAKGYQRLKDIRFYISMEETYSDEEEEGEEQRDAEDDEEDEEDWADEDEEFSDEYESDNADGTTTTSGQGV